MPPAAEPRRQRQRPSRRTWIFGSLAALALAIVAVVLLFDWNWVKGWLEAQVSSRLGRPFQIAGDLDVDLGLHPRITIHDARLANPPWAGDQPMLEVQRAEFVVDLPALWNGRIELPELSVSKPTLRLETRPDGPPNWRFKESSGGGPVIPEIGRLQMTDARISYQAKGTGKSIVAHLDEVRGSTDRPGDQRGMALTATGQLGDQPLHLEVSGPPVAELRQGTEPYKAAVNAELGQSDIAGTVTVDLSQDVPAISAKLHSSRVETGDFGGLLSRSEAGGQPTALASRPGDPPAPSITVPALVATAHAATGDPPAAAENPPDARPGTADQPAAAPDDAAPATAAVGAADKAAGVLDRIESALDQIDLSQLPGINLDLDYQIKDLKGPNFTLQNVQLKTGLKDGVPKLAVQGTGTYRQQPLTLDVNVGPAQGGPSQQKYRVDADIEAGQSRIAATGGAETLTGLKDLALQLEVKSPDPTALLKAVGFEAPKLPGLQVNGQLARNGKTWRISDLDAKVGESDLSGSLAVDLSGERPHLTADLRSDRLRAADLMPGKGPVPPSEVRPIVPPAGLSLKKLPDVDADLKFQGEDVQLPEIVLQQLKADVTLRNRVAIGEVSGQGTFRDYEPIAFEVHAGNDQSLKDPQARYPVDFALHAGETKASLKGTVDHPLDYTGLDADLVVQGPDMEALGKVFGLPLPTTPPYRLAGKVTHQPDHERWNLVAIDGKVGDSDLEGDVSLELSSERPTIVADLKSERLDLDDLGVLVGAPPATEPGETASEAERQQAAAAKANPRLLPDKPLTVPNLDAIDARVRFTGESVQAKKVPVQHLSLQLTLDHGKLRLEPLRLEVAGGQLETKADLDSHDQILDGQIEMSLKQIKLDQLLSRVGIKLADVKVQKEGAGTFGGGAKLKTRGKSVHDLAANADGEIVVIMNGGQINALIIEGIGLDVGEILGLLVTEPKEGASTTVPIQCFVGRFGVHQGVMKAQALVLDTPDSTITGKGTIDLGKETLSLELVAHPKDVSVLTASTPIGIQGTLKHPKVDVISKELAGKTLAALALGVVLPVVGAVLPFISTGATKGSNCGQLLADAKAAMPAASQNAQ